MGLWDEKCVMVTGGVGSIGSELVRTLVQRESGYTVVLDFDENDLEKFRHELARKGYNEDCVAFHVCDLKNRKHLDRLIEDIYRPNIVVHCAAHKHVSCSQDNISETINNNLTTTMNLVDACRSSTVKPVMIHISTDKAVLPTSIMGASKTLCEAIVLTKYFEKSRIVRLGNVVGSQGSVTQVWASECGNGNTYTITDWGMSRFVLSTDTVIDAIAWAYVQDPGVYVVVPDGEWTVKQMFEAFCQENDIGEPKIRLVGRKPGEKDKEELFWPSEGRIRIPGVPLYEVSGTPIFEYYTVLEVSKEFEDQDTLDALRKVLPSVWVDE